MTDVNIKNLESILDEISTVSDRHLDLLFDLQQQWTETFMMTYCDSPYRDDLLKSMKQDTTDRYSEIKDVLLEEFHDRFRQELFPLGIGNESTIPTKVDSLSLKSSVKPESYSQESVL